MDNLLAEDTLKNTEEDTAAAVAKLANLTGASTETIRVEKASVLVDQWADVRAVYDQHVAALQEASQEASRLAAVLLQHYGIRVPAVGQAVTSPTPDAGSYALDQSYDGSPRVSPVSTQSVAEIRASAAIPGAGSEKDFAASISNSLNNALRNIK